MLTEKSESDKKWGWLPALRSILESRRVPDHYLGSSSVLDNVFDRMHRLMEIEILVHEHRADIIEMLGSDARRQIVEDLQRLRGALRYAKPVPRSMKRERCALI